MKQLAVRGATITLLPRGSWIWDDGPKLEIRAGEANAPISVDGVPVLLRKNVIDTLRDQIAAKKYRHVVAASDPGLIASVDVTVDDPSLSEGILFGDERFATSETSGTFTIRVGKPSVIPGTQPVIDSAAEHSGSWRISDPAQASCFEWAASDSTRSASTSPEVAALSSVDAGKNRESKEQQDGSSVDYPQIELVVTTQIDRPMLLAGEKSKQRILIDFENRKVRSTYCTGTTNVGIYEINSIGDEFEAKSRWNPDGTEVCLLVSGSTATGLFVVIGETIAATGLFVRKLKIAAFGAGVAGSSYFLTPRIDYALTILVRRDGSGRVSGNHNGFPSYSVKTDHCPEPIYQFSHPPGPEVFGVQIPTPAWKLVDKLSKVPVGLQWKHYRCAVRQPLKSVSVHLDRRSVGHFVLSFYKSV